MRYRLDDLGWHQFETLVQSVLKADLGIGIESWGGRRDFGIDSYLGAPLNFPTKDVLSDGPFVFQVKFIENANATGARPRPRVMSAVAGELSRINSRIEERTWEYPSHYVFVTNSPLTAELRKLVETTIETELDDTKCHTMSGDDVCDLLDNHPNLRRAFPQILSLRDLDTLLAEVVNKETLERSNASLGIAREYASAFVPTRAYRKAWEVLRQYHYCVLEGPPEMGKTAIAWMVALTQITLEWQAVACDDPEDFHRMYARGHPQVFVADDAFGRTEYDPARGKKWEKGLPRILPILANDHWLIWTSRKHILKRAVRKMDLEAKASSFPSPGDVLVDASNLSTEEKALILYRHAKAADLVEESKQLVKGHASEIVRDRAFTPERIRRFVQERLPEITLSTHQQTSKAEILREVQEAIRNPTERMRKTFNALPTAHKWILMILLEERGFTSLDRIEELYLANCPPKEVIPFAQVMEELREAFIKVREFEGAQVKTHIDWIHPSYRDLVIDMLSDNPALRSDFLGVANLEGIMLAISEQGGGSGERSIPFIKSTEDWKMLKLRCESVAESGSRGDLRDLLHVLITGLAGISNEEGSSEIVDIAEEVLSKARHRWAEEGRPIAVDELSAYCEVSIILDPLPPIPDVSQSWSAVLAEFKLHADELAGGEMPDPEPLKHLVDLANVVEDNEPRFLRKVQFPAALKAEAIALVDALTDYEVDEHWLDEAYEYREEAARLASLADFLAAFSDHFPSLSDQCSDIAERFTSLSQEFEEEAIAREFEPDPDDLLKESAVTFDVDALFIDL